MWNKHINLIDARLLSKEFCDSFGLIYCEVYFVDVLDRNSLIQPYGQYIHLQPPHVLVLDSYLVINKNSGDVLQLNGRTVYPQCADGLKPCRFIGYEFKNEEDTYFIYEDGTFTITEESDEVVVKEKGEWTY